MRVAQLLELEINKLQNELTEKQAQLSAIRNSCQHEWSKVEYIPHTYPGYSIPARGSGSDWQCGMEVPAKVTKQWKRKCNHCGLEQITRRIKKETKCGEIGGTTAEVEVPQF